MKSNTISVHITTSILISDSIHCNPNHTWNNTKQYYSTNQFKAEPLVPIGCLTTAFFLGSGIQSFYNRDPKKSQTMMRLRVGSQFATILIFMGYAGMNAFTWDESPRLYCDYL